MLPFRMAERVASYDASECKINVNKVQRFWEEIPIIRSSLTQVFIALHPLLLNINEVSVHVSL